MGRESNNTLPKGFTVQSKSTSFKLLAVLTGTTVVLAACSPNNENASDTDTATTTNTETESKEVDPVYGEKNGLDLIELQDDKPEVAEVQVDNKPDRIAMNITEDPATEMAFNWYTKDALDDSMLRVSDQEDMSGAMEFPAETTEVTSRYAERDKDGYYICLLYTSPSPRDS